MPEQPVSPKSTDRGRRPAWIRWLIGPATILLGVLLIVWNIFPAPTIDTPLTLVRNAQGEFEADQTIPGATLQVQAGGIQAKNNLISANSSSHGGDARNSVANVLLICKSHDALSQRVAADLLAELKKVPHYSEIKYIPPGHPLPTSGRAPDLFIQLEMLSLQESGLIAHQVDARLRARWGNSLVESRHTYTNHQTPPLIDSHTVAQLEHHSATREVASSAAKYKLVAADIAKQFGGAITKEINDRVQKNGVLPDLPAEFFAEYQQPPELPLDGFASELIFSGSGLFKHNETVWQCRSEAPLGQSLAQLRQRLVDLGYKAGEPAQPMTYLRATKDDSVVEAFADHPGVFGQLPDAEQSQQDHAFIVTYTEWATTEERHAAVERLLDAKADLGTLMIFEQALSQQQNQRLLERFAADPTPDAGAWKWAAWRYHRNKDEVRAREALENAVVLLPLAKDASAVEGSLSSLAKELGDEKLVERLKKQPLDLDRVKRLGVEEATLGSEPVKIQFDAGGSARLLVRGSGEDWSFVVCSVREIGSGAAKHNEVHFAQVSPHGSSQTWGQNVTPQSSATHVQGLSDSGRLELRVSQLPGQPRFELTATLLPAAAQVARD